MKAYLDRIEDQELAVLIIEESKKQFTLPVGKLPIGSTPGIWFDVKIENEKITEIMIDNRTTEAKKKSAEDLMTKLRNKKSESRFKKQ